MAARRIIQSPHVRSAFIGLALFVAIVFSCRGLTPGQMANIAHPSAHAGMSMPLASASCCSFSDMGSSALAHGQLQSALVSVYMLFLAFVVVFSFWFVRAEARAPSPYRGRAERRYGGTRLFSGYVHLFSQGILHPKTF